MSAASFLGRRRLRKAVANLPARPAAITADDEAALLGFVAELAAGGLLPFLLAAIRVPAGEMVEAAKADRATALAYQALAVAGVAFVDQLEHLTAVLRTSAAVLHGAVRSRPDADAIDAEAQANHVAAGLAARGFPMLNQFTGDR